MKKILLLIVLICLLQEFVIGRNIVKRDCCNNNNCGSNSNCNSCSNCNSNCNNCNSNSNCNNCNSNSNCNNCNSNSNCNNCNSNSCRNNCQNENDCDQKCSPSPEEDQPPILVPFPPAQTTPVSSPINNINNYNFTADITLTNVINTLHNISIPIKLNNTNVNHITIEEDESQTISEGEEVVKGDENCCITVEPRTCDESACYVRMRRQCSSAVCSNNQVMPVPIQPAPPTSYVVPNSPCSQQAVNPPPQYYPQWFPWPQYQYTSPCSTQYAPPPQIQFQPLQQFQVAQPQQQVQVLQQPQPVQVLQQSQPVQVLQQPQPVSAPTQNGQICASSGAYPYNTCGSSNYGNLTRPDQSTNYQRSPCIQPAVNPYLQNYPPWFQRLQYKYTSPCVPYLPPPQQVSTSTPSSTPPSPTEAPPVRMERQICPPSGMYPYNICGSNFGNFNCGSCYYCNGGYNPQQCSSSYQCPFGCQVRGY